MGTPHPYRLMDTIERVGELAQERPTAVWRNLSYHEQVADMINIAREEKLDLSDLSELISELDRSSSNPPPPA